MISTKQLTYFDAVARLAHFGRAAEECAVTQPALSMQIQELERELGVKLVERGRTVRLTDAGEEVARRTAHILAEIHGLADLGASRRAPLTGRLRLGVIPSIAPYVLPRVLQVLKATYPDLDLQIRETLTEYLVAQVEEGSLDAALLALPLDGSALETMPLFEDRFLLAMSDTQAVKPKRKRADAAQLASAPLLLLEEGHCLRDQALSYCAMRDVSGAAAYGASNLSTLVQMVASGMGQTLLPEMSLDVEAARGGIRVLRFDDPQPSRTVGLAFRRTSPLKADFEALGTVIKDARTAKSAAAESESANSHSTGGGRLRVRGAPDS